jgi:uncharacterized membrane protein
MSDNNITLEISKVKKPKNLKLKPVTPRLQLEMPTTPKGKFLKTPRLKRPPKTPIPEEKTRKYLKNTTIDIPIVGEDIEIAIPEFFASPYKTKTGAIKYRLVNPLTKARYLASRKDEPSVKIIRKPIEDAVILENNSQPIPLSLFTPKDRETINRYFQVVFENVGKPATQVPNTADFRNKERGRPEILPKNIEVMRSRGQMPNTNVDVFVGRAEEGEGPNISPRSNQSYSEPPTPKEKRKNIRRKPLKYADKTPAERRRILQNQKNESGKLARDTEKYGLEEALRRKEEKRQQDSAKGDNWWVTGLVDEVAKISEKKPKKLSKKEQRIAEQIARGANAGGVVGEGLNEKNKIFSNVIMPKSKKVCSECGMKNCECDDEDIEGMGLYASGSGLYAGNGLYASGGQPPRGRGIKHLHHYHRTEMTGEGIVHHHHHMEGGKITMKSIGSDIKKAFSPVQKAFEPVKTAFEKVEDVATPYNAEVAAHYLIPAAGAALGGAAGSVIGGPLGGIVGSAGGSYGGVQLTKEIGVDDNTTFKGFGMKHKKGSAEAKEWGRRMREARLAKMNK